MQWACSSCGFNNRPSNEVCGGAGPLGCKTPKAALGGDVEGGSGSFAGLLQMGVGDWFCNCGFRNRASNDVCGGFSGTMGCKAPKSEAPGIGSFGASRKPRNSAASSPYAAALKGADRGPGQWQCSACGFNNRGSNEICGGGGHLGCKLSRADGGGAGTDSGMANLLQDAGMASLLQDSGMANLLQDAGGMATLLQAPGMDNGMATLLQALSGAKGGIGLGGSSNGLKTWKCTVCGFMNKASNLVCGGSGPIGCKANKPEE